MSNLCGKSSNQRLNRLLYPIKKEWKSIVFLFMLLVLMMIVAPAILQTRTPIAYIVSGSMENSYNIGDIIIIKGASPSEIKVGDSIAYVKPTDPSTIIFHRVCYVYEDSGKMYFITKGDNNNIIDTWNPVPSENLVGIVIYRIPYIGYVPLILSNPILLMEIIVLLLILLFMPSPNIKINRKIRGIILLISMILLMLFTSIEVVSLSEKFDVKIIKLELKSTSIRTGNSILYLVAYLQIESQGLSIKSIKEVKIKIYSDNRIIGLGIWRVTYFYNGEKRVSIAIILKEQNFDKIELEYRLEDIFGNYKIIRKVV